MSWSAEVDRVESSFVTGRLRKTFGPSGTVPRIELWIDGVLEKIELLGLDEPDPAEFRLALPHFCFDTENHEIAVRVGWSIHRQGFRSLYDGFLDDYSTDLIRGWAVDRSRPETPVQIDVDVNGVIVGRTLANLFREDLQASLGFQYRLRDNPALHRSFILRARVAGTDIDLQNSPVLSLSRSRVVQAAKQINTAFHFLEQRLLWDSGGRGPKLNLTVEERGMFTDLLLDDIAVADVLELQQRFLRQMQHRLTGDYARRDFSVLGINYPNSLPRRPRTAHRDRPVDIAVPLQGGVEDIARCLNSILHSAAGCRYQIICILGNPSATDVAAFVHRQAKLHPEIVVLEDETNLGLSEAANRAMQLNRDRDVVLLQSNCEVHGDWLLRLQQAAYEGPGAGMVNPLTNDGGVLSYPALGLDLPRDSPSGFLDAVARKSNAGRTVTIPAASSGCLYIRRGCLDDLGFFHNDQASGGYYAEKYFSVNAAARGWRTVVATDVFVESRGRSPFQDQDTDALENARQAFEQWCPFYKDSVTDFIVDDPLLPARRELDIGRLLALELDNLCFVTHGSGGGTERHLQDLTEALAIDGVGALTLFCLPDRHVSVTTAALENVENLRYRLDEEFDRLVQDLARLRVKHLHFQTNIDVPREIFELPERLGITFDITVHDYAWFCPRVTLVNHSGAYCGEPPISVCETCAGGGVTSLTEVSRDDLVRARRVFCPSEDVFARMQRHFDLPNLIVRAHPEWIAPSQAHHEALAPGERLRVATIGRISGHKGLRVLRECAADALEWGLPIDFLVVGSTSDDAQFGGLTNVEITGPYQESEVDDLIARMGVRVALLPSTCPETYSYTLSIALRNGLVPVAFDLGAIAERVRRVKTGLLLPLGSSPALVNKALLAAGGQRVPHARNLGTGYLNMLRDYYELA